MPLEYWRNMADKYASFLELERGECRGVYRVRSRLRRAAIAVIAPHGGSIEAGTSEIARKIAGVDFSFYAFEGRKKQDHLQKAFAYDIHIRRDVDEKFSPEGIKVISHDIGEGTVYEKKDVKITAFLVDHGPVKPSFGYRLDYQGHSVAISGDTRPSENLVKFCKGVDVLIHEALDAEALRKSAENLSQSQFESILGHHTTPEQAGQIFSRVKPRMAVYSHISDTTTPLLQRTRKTYAGRVEVGEDLMTIKIGDEVEVSRPIR